MHKTVMENSKKGFSLPMAIAVSLFLIIISTSLLFISIQSMSSTTMDISGRQAYLNVKSSLEYARSYYSTFVTDYSKVGTEYLIMNDPGGTIDGGAKIEKNADSVAEATTYVMAVYKKGEGSNKSTLTLTAFSRYSDAYGNKSKVARLSITYTVGSSGPNRLTIIGGTPKSESTGGVDSITLNVKKPKSMDSMLLTYYVWTYRDKDKGNAYQGFYNSSNTVSSFDWDKDVIKSKGWLSRLNTTTMESNLVEPNDPWGKGHPEGSYLQNGPQGVFADVGNGWYMGEYFPSKDYVPWFNVMFAQQGSVLKGTEGPSNIYNSQVNEMLHLWYLDPADKNIYFEFVGDQKTEKGEGYSYEQPGKRYFTKYYEGAKWDGKKGLEDTVVVYVKNQKTTIHLRIKDVDDTNVVTSLQPALRPKIKLVESTDSTTPISGTSYIGDSSKRTSNIEMQYEGCGWWVANVETNRSFNITFQYSGGEHKAWAIDANSVSNEFWFVENNGLNPHMTEDSALRDLDVLPGSYVTVHAKTSEYNTKPNPYLIYANPGIESTPYRQQLLDACNNSTQLVKSRYKTASYNNVVSVRNSAYVMLKNKDFIRNQPGPTDDLRMNQADALYKAKFDELKAAIEALENVETQYEDLKNLIPLVNQGKYAETQQQNNGEYDSAAFEAFKGTAENPSNYMKAQAAQNDPKSVTLDEVAELEIGLGNDLATLRAARLDRQTLSARVQKLKKYEKLHGAYEEAYQNAFNEAIANARTALGVKYTSQGALDTALEALNKAKSDLDEHAISVLNFDRLNALKAEANTYLNQAEKKNCTDETYNALETAMNKATDDAPSKTKQSDVDAIADELEAAINGFTIMKPVSSMDELKKNGQLRFWVINKCSDPDVGFNIEMIQSGSDTGTKKDFSSMGSWVPVNGDRYRYEDIALATTQRVIVSTTKAGVAFGDPFEVNLETVENYNVCVVIDEDAKMSRSQLVTVYGDFDGDEVKGKIGGVTNASSYESPYYVFRYVVTDENKEDQFNVVNKFNSLDAEVPGINDFYNAGAVAAPGEYIILHTLTEAADGTRKTTAKLISVESVYPKFSAEYLPPEEPSEGPTVARDGDIQLGEMIETDGDYIWFTDNPNVDGGAWYSSSTHIYAYFWTGSTKYSGNWPGADMGSPTQNSSGENVFKIKVPEGAQNVIFTNNAGKQTHDITVQRGQGYYKTNWSDGKMNVALWPEAPTTAKPASNYGPYESNYIYLKLTRNDFNNLHVYMWGGTSNGAPFPGYYMEYSHMDGGKPVYKVTPPKGADQLLFNNGNGDLQTVDIDLVVGHHYELGGGGGKSVEVKDLDATVVVDTDISGGGGTYDAPGYNEADLTGLGGELKMAYVGGNKVRIVNASYKELFGEGGKKNHHNQNIGDGNPFGGTTNNNDSDGRLGYAKLTPYYDWFEFKIPVSEQSSYDFAIKGLSSQAGKQNVQTKIVEKARGNVWVEMLSSNNSGGGHFQNYNIYTFDPEQEQIGDTLSVYFRLPYVDTAAHPDYVRWRNPQIYVSGPFADTLTDYSANFDGTLSRAQNINIYVKKGILKNNPFLKFTVYGPDSDDPTKEKYYEFNTCFQGGDYVLFDPSLNNNFGGWEEFVSDQERLKRAVNLLRSSYYGCKIVSQYDSEGIQVSDAFFTYSQGLKALYTGNGNESDAFCKTVETNGCTYYVTKNYDDADDNWCYNTAYSINAYVKAARNLYSVMNESKQYIATPLTSSDNSFHGNSGGTYPEYKSRTVKNRKYSASSISTIRRKLSDGEKVFAANSTAESMNNAANAIKSAISGREIDSEGSIAMVFYDCQDKVENGSTFQVKFTTEEGSMSYINKDVTEFNPERYPIIFLTTEDTNGNNKIYNVQFVETDLNGNITEHKSYPSMEMDDAWVYIDQLGNGKWSKNSASDYREINADIFQMSDGSDKQEYKMIASKVAGSTYQPMTLLFTKDAEVIPASGVTEFTTYTIKAGSYYIDDSNVDSVATGGVVNLYTSKAKSFFTNVENIGYYYVTATGLDGKEIQGKDLNGNEVKKVSNGDDWRVNDDFKTGASSQSGYVNFAASEGSFTKYPSRYAYESDKGIFFRWESTSPLYLSSTVKLVGSEFKFANMGVLDGTQTRTPHFYLISNDVSQNSMYVEFRTDFYVKYIDDKGYKRQFAIREGKYEIRKPKDDEDRSYIADLFDYEYWKVMENITFIGRGTFNDEGSGSTGELVDGTYSN